MKWFLQVVALCLTTAAEAFVTPTCARGLKTCAAAAGADVPLAYDVPAAWAQGRPHALNSMDEYRAKYARSIEDPAAFWRDVASEFEWRGAPLATTGLKYNFDKTKGKVFSEWFKGSTTNLAYNALDKQIELGRGAQVAMFAERNGVGEASAHQPDQYTYSELRDEVNKLANALLARGVKQGDRVAIFMAHVPEAAVAMLACARIGAVHCVVFGGFSAEALASRISDCGATAVITQDGVMRGGKLVALKAILDQALPLVAAAASSDGPAVHTCVVLQRLGTSACADTHAMAAGRDVWWADLVRVESPDAPTAWLDAEAPCFVLYTSGSTGTPKGILHTTGGYLLGAATTFKYSFDLVAGDVYFCTADCGWVTGHSYVAYGPLLNGATQVVFEGVPTYPSAGRLWDIVDKFKVTHLYTAPTLIRALMGAGDAIVQASSRASLKLLGTVGEPINPEAWRWFFETVGNSNCPVVDTWWQTETGAHMLQPLPIPGATLKPGAAMLPAFGVQPCLLDPKSGLEVAGSPAEGLLGVKAPWPSALRGVWNNYQRFEDTYFSYPGFYLTGDGARRDADGSYWITGRVDDVVIVSGHNIGTAEVESAVVLHPLVAEAAAVGIDHPVKGQALYVFVDLMQGTPRPPPGSPLDAELKASVRKLVGSFASPDVLHYAPSGLPKTRSGKIMRRILRKVASLGPAVDAKDLGDTSTLADPSVVDDLIRSHADAKRANATTAEAAAVK